MWQTELGQGSPEEQTLGYREPGETVKGTAHVDTEAAKYYTRASQYGETGLITGLSPSLEAS